MCTQRDLDLGNNQHFTIGMGDNSCSEKGNGLLSSQEACPGLSELGPLPSLL